MKQQTVLTIKNIYKEWGRQVALDTISLQLKQGTVLAIMGENGAGKSVLLRILSGLLKPDSGSILKQGKEITLSSPAVAMAHGISSLQQENHLWEHLSVADNIFMSTFVRKQNGINTNVSKKVLYQKAAALLLQFGCNVHPSKTVRHLASGEKRLVAIARAFALKSDILLLDEPTDALTQVETTLLFNYLRQLCKAGTCIVIVTHKLSDVYALANEVVTLREAKIVSHLPIQDATPDILSRMSFGKEIKNRYPKVKNKIGNPVLQVQNLASTGLFPATNLTLHRGEVLGIAGLMGSGRTLLAKGMMGIVKSTSGNICVHGRAAHIHSPVQAAKLGIAFMPEVLSKNMFPNFNVLNNIMVSHKTMLGSIHGTPYEKTQSQRIIHSLAIKPESSKSMMYQLSSGNLQKTIIARMKTMDASIYIMDEPTKNLDIAAKVEIYNILNQLTAREAAVIFISSDINELIGMSDRILVMHNGAIIKQLYPADFSVEKIYRYASGVF